MREILFRGKRTDKGEWAEGYYIHRPTAVCIGESNPSCIWVPPVDPDDSTKIFEVFSETVGQFTGLTDKNGRKIFEGDIIKCKVHEINGYRVRRGVVEYHGVGFIMNLDPNSWYDQKNISFDCEVIGNIYDNPELLEGS